jgi:hypothetical protein
MVHSGAGMLRFFSFSVGGLFGQQDEIHKHKAQAQSTSTPMEMLIEGFGSD